MTNEFARNGGDILSRRAALKAIGLGAAGIVLNACAGSTAGTKSSPTGTALKDFSDRFARYEPAAEPNGDLAKVVWPDFVLRAGPEVKQLYEFQIQNGDLMRYMPCFCGCGADGHRSNRDCYVKQVNSDGSVVLDPMAPT